MEFFLICHELEEKDEFAELLSGFINNGWSLCGGLVIAGTDVAQLVMRPKGLSDQEKRDHVDSMRRRHGFVPVMSTTMQ